ncbi:sensor histidine kinase [Filimonas lacunae]|nr:ATP-binding protein [Filimonas lacunae]BAV07556.1 sensor histidine kinase [Filimonas lacunae]
MITKQLEPHFAEDVRRIQELEIVPAILELICKTTGMRFAAVARVTDDRWIACAVKDEVDFGLQPGGELRIETTICNEIRDSVKPVVIDEVATDAAYCAHHTPRMYGFQSYISIPIILKDNTFFGTLCALDARPMPLKAGNMVDMFTLFADLIAYHLLSRDQLRNSGTALQVAKEELADTLNELRQFDHLSRHTLQEPLRKLQLYSDMIASGKTIAADKTQQLAERINSLAKQCSAMIKELTDYNALHQPEQVFKPVDLNIAVQNALTRLHPKMEKLKAVVYTDYLHTIPGVGSQLNQLFYHFLDNALNYSLPGKAPVIKISSVLLEGEALLHYKPDAAYSSYCRVCIEDNGIGINKAYQETVFDLFVRLNPGEHFPGMGTGLSQCKKIVRNHEGAILVESEEGAGCTFSLIFPVEKQGVTKC